MGRITRVFILIMLPLATLAVAAPASAATLTVNTLDDELNSDGDCAMREAIQAANTDTSVDACGAGSGTDIINLPFGTLQLSIPGSNEENNQTGDLDILEDVTIDGTGPSTAINAASAGDRAIEVHSGTVTIQDLKVQNGSASGGTGPGGNILNRATLTVSNATLEDGTANAGGGIYNAPFATLTLSNSSLVGAPTGNTAVLGGGLNNDGNATVTNTTISGGKATAGGGGIFNPGMMSITGSTISGNDGGGNGGGILNGNNGTLTIATTTVTNNTASDHPGIANDGTLTITNDTVISANAGAGGGCGGGLWNTGDLNADDVTIDSNTHGCGAGFYNVGNAALTNSTVTNNVASGGPGGIGNDESLTIDGSTISGNSANEGAGIENGGSLILSNSTVTGNTSSASGGGIVNFNNATIDASTVSNNSGANVGGILNHNGGVLTIQNGTIISGNSSTDVACGCGGGLVNADNATFDVDASTIDGNTADAGGGLSNFGIGTITNSTVSDNVATGFGGGGILNSGKLTIDGSTISGNSAEVGGGINNGEGTLTITNSIISGNDGDGGGLGQFGPGLTTVKDSTISGNTAPTGGAGVRLNGGGTVNILRTTISGNVAAAGGGGGIHNGPDGSTNTVNITESTISGNSADEGGGLFNGVVATIVNSTFSGNTSTTGGAGVATVEPDAVSVIRSSTISGSGGPGIGNEGLTRIKNTIVANSTGGSDCDGTVTSAGYNLIENPGGGCTIAGNLDGNVVGQDPKLAPLGNYGGPTLTHALQLGSPAFEAGSPDCPPPDIDQRGVARPQFLRCDIGADESQDLLGIVDVTVDDPATLLPTGRVQVNGSIWCGPAGDTFRVFVQAEQASTGAISRVGFATNTCSGNPGDPWSVTLRRKSGSPPFQPGQVEVCFEARTFQGTTLIDRFTGCAVVGLSV